MKFIKSISSFLVLLLIVVSCKTVSPVKRIRKEQATREFSSLYPNGWTDWNKEYNKKENKRVKGPIKNKFK
jgi:hypothetical protein